ncbi:MAG: SIR2 family protein [Sedimentisphaerales bacterium]
MFLIGAGFTRAVFSEAPLNKDLFHEVVNTNPKTKLNLYSKKYGVEDIEILLTRLDLEIAETKSNVLEQDRARIEMDIFKYFSRFRFAKTKLDQNPWLGKFAREVLCENDAIVTTNYDCFLEGLLDFYEVWSPSKGYGGVEVDVPGSSLSKLPNPKNILIYKIRGSENFHTSAVQSDRVDPRRIALAVKGGQIYPKSGNGSNLGVIAGRPYVIAPSFLKVFYPQIHRMMNEALRTALLARNFVIIGSSIRPEDGHLWLLIDSFCEQNNKDKKKKLIIVDPHADDIHNKFRGNYPQIQEYIHTCVIKERLEKVLEKLKYTLDVLTDNHCQ